MKTGWCTAIGAAQHAACRRPETCSCECHQDAIPALNKGPEHFGRVDSTQQNQRVPAAFLAIRDGDSDRRLERRS